MATDYRLQPFIQTHYMGPTNHRPARVKAKHMSTGKSLILSWDHALNPIENHMAAAVQLLVATVTRYGDAVEAPAELLCCGTQDSRGYIFTAVPKSV